MHAVFVRAYHLALLPIHLALLPVWRPLLATLLVALIARLAGQTRAPRGAALAAGIAVLTGWLLQDPPLAWPPPPQGRLPGLALILLADAALRNGGRKAAAAPFWLLPATALAAAWWLRGAPLTGPAIVNTMPVLICLAAAFPLARRLARADTGWGSRAAALSLAGGLAATGAAPHWVRAALVPLLAALVLPSAGQTLAGLLVAASAATVIALDRGRFTPVDAACLLPLLAWPLVPRLAPRITRQGPALACLLAAAFCAGLAWLTTR